MPDVIKDGAESDESTDLSQLIADTTEASTAVQKALASQSISFRFALPIVPHDLSPTETALVSPLLASLRDLFRSVMPLVTILAAQSVIVKDLTKDLDALGTRADKIKRMIEHAGRSKKQVRAPDAHNASKERRTGKKESKSPPPVSELPEETVDSAALQNELNVLLTQKGERTQELLLASDEHRKAKSVIEESLKAVAPSKKVLDAAMLRITADRAERLRSVVTFESITKTQKTTRGSIPLSTAAIDQYFTTVTFGSQQMGSTGHILPPYLEVLGKPAFVGSTIPDVKQKDASPFASVKSLDLSRQALAVHLSQANLYIVLLSRPQTLGSGFALQKIQDALANIREHLGRPDPAGDPYEVRPMYQAIFDALAIAAAIVAGPVRTRDDLQAMVNAVGGAVRLIRERRNAFEQESFAKCEAGLMQVCASVGALASV